MPVDDLLRNLAAVKMDEADKKIVQNHGGGHANHTLFWSIMGPKKEIDETKMFVSNSKINFPFVYVAQPYQGTDMFHDFKNEGLLNEFQIASNVGRTKYGSKYYTHKELNKMRTHLYERFYIKRLLNYTNPLKLYREFLSKVKSLEDAKYVYKNTSSILSRIKHPFYADNFYKRLEFASQ